MCDLEWDSLFFLVSLALFLFTVDEYKWRYLGIVEFQMRGVSTALNTRRGGPYLGGPDDGGLGVLQLHRPLHHSILLHLERRERRDAKSNADLQPRGTSRYHVVHNRRFPPPRLLNLIYLCRVEDFPRSIALKYKDSSQHSLRHGSALNTVTLLILNVYNEDWQT